MARRPAPSPGANPAQRARAALEAGRIQDAIAQARRLSQKDPSNPAIAAVLAEALLRADQPEQALFAADRAPALETGLLGIRALHALKRHDEALRRAERLAGAHPRSADALAALASAHASVGHPEATADAAGRAAALEPGNPGHALAHASALLETGRARQAIALIGSLAMRHPDAPGVLAAFASALNYTEQASPAYIRDAHRAFGRALERATPPLQTPDPDPDPERPLRVGFLSRDLHRHSCAYFLEPLIANLDPASVETTCYSMGPITDDFTRRIRAACAHWRDLPGAPPKSVIEQIRKDRIDVLIECMGLTAGVRLAILAARPAPLQLTYLAYPNTTGLSRIDARIVDAITDPATDACDALATERLVRLDRCFLCYQPDARAPDVQPRPEGEPLTFISLNTIQKINPTTLDLWSAVLRARPETRLLLKHRGADEPASRARIDALFRERDIDPARVELIGHLKPIDEHLGSYHRADLALDTFPYAGTTTTCEAAWMGVPTLTLAGDRHSARVGASINHALGLDELTADTPERFVEIACEHAADPARLRSARLARREQMRCSPLCDAPDHARAFAAALRSLWRERVSH